MEDQVRIMIKLASEIFDYDLKACHEWIIKPNDLTSGKTPFEVCEDGDGEFIINWLKGRLGKPGAKPF